MSTSFTTRLFGLCRTPPRRKELYVGRHKNVMEGTSPGTVVLFFKDTLYIEGQSFEIPGAGALNQRISETLLTHLEMVGISSHFIKSLNMREHLVQGTEVLPFRVRLYTVVTEDLAKRYDLDTGTVLETPLFEFITKKGQLLSKDHMLSFDLAEEREIFEIEALARRTCDLLFGFMAAKKCHLQRLDLSFGRLYAEDNPFDEGEIVVIDELSPRTMHLGDVESEKNFTLSGALASPNPSASLTEIYEILAQKFDMAPTKNSVDA